jgi:hypothetical protein
MHGLIYRAEGRSNSIVHEFAHVLQNKFIHLQTTGLNFDRNLIGVDHLIVLRIIEVDMLLLDSVLNRKLVRIESGFGLCLS